MTVCQTLDVHQLFPQAFSNFVLGGIKRVYRSITERLTPFLNNSKTNWDSVLGTITFSINISVYSTTGYSPFMVLYGQEPQFPLTASLSQNSVLSDTSEFRHYMNNQQRKLDMIRQDKPFPNIQLDRCKKVDVRANKPSFVFSSDDFRPLATTRAEIPQVQDLPAISPDLSAGNPSHVPAVRSSARLQSKNPCPTSLCLTMPCLKTVTFVTKSRVIGQKASGNTIYCLVSFKE
ncbi:retrovirus-related pol polyprotein from transposon 412 [Plakobranchus ocellatus]|uniref:Retrovirus-related pol polyprotein from transposon 412 n=1 Tax=Plakobranchus ocellatus TaxID=259542 RepID=A0AAV4DIZ2_9GAST|nr:retrovirus-related pol polyprotein from transposon 412 [Plakobranchus ocellatus]